MSLHDDEPLDLKDRRAIAATLASPDAEMWWDGLPDNTRRAVMNKLLSALSRAESPRDIGTLTRSIMKADELDLKRKQGVQAPAQHLHLHGELANMNANELRAYVASRLAVRAESPDGNREG